MDRGSSGPRDQEEQEDRPVVQRLQGLLPSLVSKKDVHHAIVAVESGDGSLRWIGAAGDANPGGAPMRADTPFFIASVDKLFTAAVILKLHERGRVDLEQPVAASLPRTLISGLHRLRGTDHTGAITVRNLLGHTSGLADWLEDSPKGGRSLVERVIREGDMALSLNDVFQLVRDQLTPHFPPQPAGARRPRVRYCDTNFMLLIAIIEAVTGRPLHEVHEEMLFRPLGLRHTWISGHSQPLGPTPAPATLWAGNQPLEIPLLMRSLRGVYSTATDTLKFLRGLMHGEVFDDPATLGLAQQRWNRFGLPLDKAALRAPPWPIEYGLGMMRFHHPVHKLLVRLPRRLRPIYPAPAVVGHTGSTGSWLFYCPQLDMLLSGTVNQVTAGSLPFRFVPKVLQVVDPAVV